jgi:SAM-dependent methyltransferase
MAEFTGERVIPGQVDLDLWNEHFARYAFASRLARRRRVLDIGSGSGYGSAELARVASSVTGLDVSGDAVAYSRRTSPAVRFLQASGAHVPLRDAAFDLVVAFEVIEHIPDWQELLSEARRLLAPGGQFILSTPNKSYYAESRKRTGPNPFHVHEFEFDEFRKALQDVFPYVSLFVQNHTAGIVFEPLTRASASDVRIEGEKPDAASSHFYIAVCALSPQTGAPTFIYIPTAANVLRERELHIERLESELATKNQWLDEARAEHQKLVDQFRRQTAELEQSNQWAESLNQELDAARARYYEAVTALEAEVERQREWGQRLSTELDAKVAELGQCVEYLHTAEREVEARTKWAFGLEEELKAFQSKLEASRWVRLGRTLGVGPVVGRQ